MVTPDEFRSLTKASDILSVALADLAKVETDARYVVDMTQWHRPSSPGRCRVSLAGAVMAITYRVPHTTYANPMTGDFTVRDRQMLGALENFRAGCVNGGIHALGLPWPVDPKKIHGIWPVRGYDRDPGVFRQELAALAAKFKEIGL